MSCPACGAENDRSARACLLCSTPLNTWVEWSAHDRPSGWSKASIGGILILLSGVLAILNGIYFIAPEAINLDPTNITWLGNVQTFGYLTIAAGCIGILGGMFSVQRTSYLMCVAGGLLAAMSIGFTLGLVLGLAGLILVGFSRKEFVTESRFT